MWKILDKLVKTWKKPEDFSDNSIECLVHVPDKQGLQLIKCEATGRSFGFSLQITVPSENEDNMMLLVQETHCPNRDRFWELIRRFNKEIDQYTWEDGTPFVPQVK